MNLSELKRTADRHIHRCVFRVDPRIVILQLAKYRYSGEGCMNESERKQEVEWVSIGEVFLVVRGWNKIYSRLSGVSRGPRSTNFLADLMDVPNNAFNSIGTVPAASVVFSVGFGLLSTGRMAFP
jgi:hypothetical protein